MAALPNIPGYKIGKQLGQGGMAVVYQGLQENLNRKVAIKILEPSLLKNGVIRGRFEREAQTSASLRHSNIIQIVDTGKVGDYYYIIMEFLEETMKDRMYGYPPDFCLKPEEAIRYLKPIINALSFAHKQGIIHRDIKTENIMFRSDGTPVLTDFGIARALDGNNQLTQTGVSLGTPYYMSPEQCLAEQLDGRSDFYSLGVVLYETITGQKPYKGDTPTAIALKQIQEPVPMLPEALNHFQPLIDKMMAKSKNDRPADGSELIRLMDGLLHTITDSPRASRIEDREKPKPVKDVPANAGQTSIFTPASMKNLGPESATTVLPTHSRPKPKGQAPSAVKTPTTLQSFFKEGSSFADKLHNLPNKTKIELVVLSGLLMVVFFIFFNLGKGSSEPESANPTTMPARTVVKTDNKSRTDLEEKYRIDRDRAIALFNKGNFQEAAEIVTRWKAIRPTPQLQELERQINEAIEEEKETLFNSYLENAENFMGQKNFTQAKENIELAKNIKSSPELEALEKRLKSAEKRSGVTRTKKKSASLLKQKDESAYNNAKSTNTVDAYRKYIDQFPTGRHLEEAISSIEKLKEAEALRKQNRKSSSGPRLNLRSRYRTLSFQDVNNMIKRRKYFDGGFNKSGRFSVKYREELVNGVALMVHREAGLMWCTGKTSREIDFKKAQRWINDLNASRFGGFSNWRLPTLEEAASLLRKSKNEEALHIAPQFTANITSIWTGDRQRPQTYWVVRFLKGIVYADSDFSKQKTLAVRTVR